MTSQKGICWLLLCVSVFVCVCVEASGGSGLAEAVSCGPVCTCLRGSRDLPVIGWRGTV